jgi:hypothetical protein
MTPIPIHNKTGRVIGTDCPAASGGEGRETPPPMTCEQRSELQKRIDERDNSLTLDELLDSINSEDPSSDSES